MSSPRVVYSPASLNEISVFLPGPASADYILLWNGDAAVLLESFELVQRTATEIIAALALDKPLPPEGGG